MQRTVVGIALVTAGCAGLTQPTPGTNAATAELRNAQGQVVGTATLAEVSGGVRVLVDARGLPSGLKGVHIHAVGRCEPPGFTSAGGHFNPDGKTHGFDDPEGPHAGDLPNMAVGADGVGRLESMNERITLAPGPESVLDADGSAIVVHAAPDDFKTDPAGNSGARIACGVIVRGK
ncbi:MAG: superoxide dismutase family protein [Candidatus Rokubacteria bacterium]|nr:superoxide dismutase family protein [Candidatus Rokubacteria bacterium]